MLGVVTLQKLAVPLLVLGAVVVAGFIAVKASAVSAPATVEIRWLIAHEPTSVFERAEKIFADELAARSDGRMTLRVLKPGDAGFSGDVPSPEVRRLMDERAIELATIPVVNLAGIDQRMLVFNLPFLFDDYAAAEAVLDGPVGSELLRGIAERTNAYALAFTFSGGFKVIPTSKKKISDARDLKSLRIATPHGLVSEDSLRGFGAVPVTTDLEDIGVALGRKDIDAIETTYTRMSTWLTPDVRYVLESNHAVFLTALIAEGDFYGSLSKSDRQILIDAAQAAAHTERADSIALAAKNRETLKEMGIEVTALSAVAKAALKELSQPTYLKYEAVFGSDLINRIRTGE